MLKKIVQHSISIYFYILPNFFQRLVWIPLRVSMHLRCNLKIKGVNNLKKVKGNFIIASTHLSEMDPLLIVSVLPFFSNILPIIYVSRPKSLYKTTFLKQFFYGGTFFKIIGAYPSYKGADNYEVALRHHLDVINRSNNVGIFPYGRIVKGKDKGKAMGGVSFLAIKSGLPIIPLSVRGTADLSFSDFYSGKRHITFTFGKPIYPKDLFRNPEKIVVNSNRNDYHVAAAKVMTLVESL